MKKYLTIGLALIMALMLAACGATKGSASNYVDAALKSVNPYDAEQVAAYWGEDMDSTVGAPETQNTEYASIIFQNMTYKINGSEEADGKAKVNVTTTNLDMGQIMADVMTEYMQQTITVMYGNSEQEMTDEELDKLFTDILTDAITSGHFETVENTVDVELEQTEDSWKITGDKDAVINAMMGDIASFVDIINENMQATN